MDVVIDLVHDDAIEQQLCGDLASRRFGTGCSGQFLPAASVPGRQIQRGRLGQQDFLMRITHGHAHFDRLVRGADVDNIRAELDVFSRPVGEVFRASLSQEDARTKTRSDRAHGGERWTGISVPRGR